MKSVLLILGILGCACIFASCTEETLPMPREHTGGEEEPVLPPKPPVKP